MACGMRSYCKDFCDDIFLGNATFSGPNQVVTRACAPEEIIIILLEGPGVRTGSEPRVIGGTGQAYIQAGVDGPHLFLINSTLKAVYAKPSHPR